VQAPEKSPGTLGDVLYKANPLGLEAEWAALVTLVAGGDTLALHALYERTHRLVFTLIVRLTRDPELAEDLTLELFLGLWRDASLYEDAHGTVLAWIMSRARAIALEQLRSQASGNEQFKRDERSLRTALVALSVPEREAIEHAFFAGGSYEDSCAQAHHIRSGLHRLRALLTPEATAYAFDRNDCERALEVCLCALHAVPPHEMAAAESHIAACTGCAREFAALRPVVESFAAWPTDVLRPPAWLQRRLTMRIAAESGEDPVLPIAPWREPPWEDVAPGIACKLLAVDNESHAVSMLVRLAPGASYPAHTHAGREELHLLDGELWIDERKLYPGEYRRAEAGSGDRLVWSGTGCTCVLVTSTQDRLV
jgi:RNA polymerase sigma-70 factor (ECF subfamily)